jgi:hypothetical protein
MRVLDPNGKAYSNDSRHTEEENKEIVAQVARLSKNCCTGRRLDGVQLIAEPSGAGSAGAEDIPVGGRQAASWGHSFVTIAQNGLADLLTHRRRQTGPHDHRSHQIGGLRLLKRLRKPWVSLIVPLKRSSREPVAKAGGMARARTSQITLRNRRSRRRVGAKRLTLTSTLHQDEHPAPPTRHPDHRDLPRTTAAAVAWPHVWQMPTARIPKRLLTAWLPQERPVGRPELTYGHTVVRTIRAAEEAGGFVGLAAALAAATSNSKDKKGAIRHSATKVALASATPPEAGALAQKYRRWSEFYRPRGACLAVTGGCPYPTGWLGHPNQD